MVFTSTYHYFYPVSHFETANGNCLESDREKLKWDGTDLVR